MPTDAQSWQPSKVDATSDRPETSAKAFSWLAEPRIILALIGLYVLGHFVLRLALSPTLGIDDAEQMLFAQHWAFGYRFRQPPLFTWLLLPVIEVFGPSIVAISLVRYALLAITFVFLYLTARLCLHDQRMAGLAALSLTLIYVFAYYAHHDLTHTTALGAMIVLLLYVTARLAKNPTWSAYAAAGLVIGLGMLAKWNFAMLAIGLPLTCLALPAYRHLVLTPKIAFTIAIAATVVAPTALWMLSHDQSVQALSSDILTKDGAAAAGTSWLAGAGALSRSILLFPLPFLPIFLTIFGRSLLARQHVPTTDFRPALTPAFFACLMLVVLGLHAFLIPLFGAVSFTERWLHPALMALPIYLFALAERGSPTTRQVTVFLASIAILVAVATTARLYRYMEGVDDCGRCREFAPFAEFAEGLRA
ncbi:MAG: glycosyltransferase family 39 protein, partial [Pseudomonadota bacterium]